MRFAVHQSLRMLEIAKDSPWNSTPCGCWRCRRTVRSLCRPPLLADVGDGEGRAARAFAEHQSLRMLEMARDSLFETPLLADAGDGDEQSVRFTELQSLRMLEMAKGRPCTSSPCGCWRCRPTAHALWRTPILADAGDSEGQSVRKKLHCLRMLEMATNNPCALPNSNPCGCWRWRRTVRETPVLADAGDGDEKSVRFVELQSLRMLETTKDSPCNSGPRGCWRWRGTIYTPCRTPLLAALEIAKTRSCNSTPCGCWRWRRAVRAKSY